MAKCEVASGILGDGRNGGNQTKCDSAFMFGIGLQLRKDKISGSFLIADGIMKLDD